jgi:hypothetical protein
MAAADKERYTRELATFKSTQPEEVLETKIAAIPPKKVRKKRQSNKDPNEPKKPDNAFA